jgi:hypothetical protein
MSRLLKSRPIGPDAVVYDNQMGATDGEDPSTGLDGGSIVIHSK